MKSIAMVASVFVLFCAGQLRAQEELDHHSEIGVSGIGAFTSETSGRGITQNATDTGGVLASLRFLFTSHQGVEIDYSHVQFSQEYLSPILGINSRIHTDQHEFTASYVLRFPVRRVAPFLSAGTGAVLFTPSRSRAFVCSRVKRHMPPLCTALAWTSSARIGWSSALAIAGWCIRLQIWVFRP
jgi:hypothetical protein